MKLLGSICLVLFLVESSIQMNIRNDEFRNTIVNINPDSTVKGQQIHVSRNQVNLERPIVKNGEPKKLKANGVPLPQGSAQARPLIVGTIPMSQTNQVDTDLAHMMVNGQNGQPVPLKDIKVNPQDIQFTVSDVPESTRLQIIEQIRAQLGSTPLTLDELNNKFVTFTATVPGEEINRTIVTSRMDNQKDISKTTRITQVRVPQGTASNYESHSTQYPPILSHSFNPVAPVATVPTS